MSRKKRRPIVTCACGCGRTGPHKARGLISTCHDRARHTGELDRYPRRQPFQSFTREQLLAMAARATAGNVARGQARLEDYVELRSWGLTRREAADRLDVTDRTTVRWHRRLRDQGATYSWLPDLPDHLTTTDARKAAA